MPILQQYETQLTSRNGTVTGTVTLRSFNYNRKSIIIQNLGAGTLYVGGSAVSSANGMRILPNETLALNSAAGVAVYCYSAGTCDVRFIEEIV